MSIPKSVMDRFIASLGGNPRLHNIKVKNLWNHDGSPRQEIHIAVRGGFDPTLPDEFEGFPVRRISWPKE